MLPFTAFFLSGGWGGSTSSMASVSIYDTSYSIPAVGTDATASLQAAIDDATSKGLRLIISKGYTVRPADDQSGVLQCRDGTYIKFLPGAYIKNLPHNVIYYEMFGMNGVSNVTLEDPHLIGSKEDNAIGTGEWGMGIAIHGGSSIQIIRPHIVDTWGDGIYLDYNPDNVTILSPYIRGCRRQGISIIGATNLTIYRPEIENIGGTAPGYGIDLEPDSNDNVFQNVVIYQPKTVNCQGGIGFDFGQLPGPNPQSCSIWIVGMEDYDTHAGYSLSWSSLAKGSYSVSGHIVISSPKFYRTVGQGGVSGWDNSITVSVSGAVAYS